MVPYRKIEYKKVQHIYFPLELNEKDENGAALKSLIVLARTSFKIRPEQDFSSPGLPELPFTSIKDMQTSQLVKVAGLPVPKKINKAKFGHNQFKKGQILKNEKGQIC